MYVVVGKYGAVFGPFQDEQSAINWAKLNRKPQTWWTALITSTEGH